MFCFLFDALQIAVQIGTVSRDSLLRFFANNMQIPDVSASEIIDPDRRDAFEDALRSSRTRELIRTRTSATKSAEIKQIKKAASLQNSSAFMCESSGGSSCFYGISSETGTETSTQSLNTSEVFAGVRNSTPNPRRQLAEFRPNVYPTEPAELGAADEGRACAIPIDLGPLQAERRNSLPLVSLPAILNHQPAWKSFESSLPGARYQQDTQSQDTCISAIAEALLCASENG